MPLFLAACVCSPELASCSGLLGISDVLTGLHGMVVNALSGPTADERSFIPESEWPKVTRTVRADLAIHAAKGRWDLLPG
ncbi:MAG: hypothetical protein WAS26_18655 [Paracoccaceae bacterium]